MKLSTGCFTGDPAMDKSLHEGEEVTPKDEVTISKGEYDELKSDSAFLNALMAAGVDNWDGYCIAQESAE